MTRNTTNIGIEKYLHTVSMSAQGVVLSPQSKINAITPPVEKQTKEGLLYI